MDPANATIAICIAVFFFLGSLIRIAIRGDKKEEERQAHLRYQKDIQTLDYRHKERMAIIARLDELALEKSLNEVEKEIKRLEDRTINKELDK